MERINHLGPKLEYYGWTQVYQCSGGVQKKSWENRRKSFDTTRRPVAELLSLL